MKANLKYRIIKSEKQYMSYCNELEILLSNNKKSDQDEIELLTLLIEKYDEEHYQLPEIDPIQLLKHLMNDHNLIAKDLCGILELSKGTVSKILNYKKGLSKETIRKLSSYFKLKQSAFNRPYMLKDPLNRKFKNAALMNTPKKMKQMA